MAQNGSNKFTDKRGSFINDVTLQKKEQEIGRGNWKAFLQGNQDRLDDVIGERALMPQTVQRLCA